MDEVRYLLAGDKALVMEYGNEISEAVNKKVRNMYIATNKYKINGVEEVIPTYRSIMIQYNPLIIKLRELKEELRKLQNMIEKVEIPNWRIIEIPTLYGGEFGTDIQFVADYNGLTIDEVISIHSSSEYLIYMLGFTPGFPYLGGMSEKIATPRLETPRTKILEGSVGIAGKQTGVYPIESPGGWRIIGRTPLKLYNPKGTPPIPLQAGDSLKFVPISYDEYTYISKQVKENKYTVNYKRSKEG